MAISSEVEVKQVRIVKGTGSQIASARQAGEILDTDLVVQTDAPEPATAEQGALADTALQPGDNITELLNNADYQTGSQVNTAISNHNTSESAHSYIQGLISSEESRAEGVEGSLSSLTTDVKSNLVSAINEVDSHADTNASDISGIKALIPNDAKPTNQLADKQFVNSSIATNTANFIGTFNSVADLEAYSGTLTNNDYAFVVGTDTAGNTVYDRYKYTDATTPASWVFEYELNNSSFTADQWAAINSLATTTKIAQITTNQNAIGTLSSLTTSAKTNLVSAINELDSNKLVKNSAITGATKCKITYDAKGLVTGGTDLQASDIPSLPISKISDITATASELNVLDGITASTTELNYVDGVTSSIQTQLDGKQPTGNYMTTDTEQSVSAGATKTFNGRVNFIGTGDAKAVYLSTDTRIDVYGTTRTVLGFANGTFLINNSAYPLNIRGGGQRPAWNGTSYLALTSDIGNATLTIQKNGVGVDTFTANATSDKTINITVPTDNNELTNGAGFITASALNGYATETWVGQQGYITGITSSMVTTALGYTPYDTSNPNGYTSNVGTVISVNNVSPDSNGNVSISIPAAVTESTVSGWGFTKNVGTVTSVNNVSPVNGNVSLSIPTVNNSTITIQKNGSTVDSFTTNASSGKTINITVPTTAADVNALPDTTVIPTVNNSTITITQGGVTKGSFTLNQSTGDTIALDAGGGSYTAGTGIDITNDVISVTSPTLTNSATGTSSLTILGTVATDNYATNIGKNSQAKDNSVAIGYSAQAQYGSSVAVGRGSQARASNSIAIGYSSDCNGSQGVAIGYSASITASYAVSIGYLAQAKKSYAIQLGKGTNNEANSFYVGTSDTNNWKMLGSDGKIPDARLNTPIPSQTGNNGKYLTTDGTNVSWATVSQMSATYDSVNERITFA